MESYNVNRPLALGILGIIVIAVAFFVFCCVSTPDYDYNNPNRLIQKPNSQTISLPKTTGKTEDIDQALQAEVSNEDRIWKEEDKIANQMINDDADVSSLGQAYEDQI